MPEEIKKLRSKLKPVDRWQFDYDWKRYGSVAVRYDENGRVHAAAVGRYRDGQK